MASEPLSASRQAVPASGPDPAQAVPPPWVALKDEELLALRLCDLNLHIEGSELEPRIQQLYSELAARGVTLRPDCYLGDEWFSPEGVPRSRSLFISPIPASRLWNSTK